MVYLAMVPATAVVCLILAYPFVQRAKRKRIEETNRAVQKILDECRKDIEAQVRFDESYHKQRNARKIINVDFISHDHENNDATDWKLVYNEELGVYQKVRR